MQTVLITGANGFVGHYLAQLLLPHYKVVATGKGANRLPVNHANFAYASLDFTDEQSVKDVLTQYKPAIVVHAGALSKPDECESNKDLAYVTNVTATEYLLKAAGALGSFFIFLSTDFIFDGEQGMYSEEDEPGPVNYYGQTKLLAEGAVKKYNGAWSIVRTVLVYGNPLSGRQNILTTVAAVLKKGEPYHVFDDQVRTPTFVEDLAAALTTIIDKRTKGVFHISGADVLTPYQMAVATARHLGLDETLIKKETAATFQQPAKRPAKTGFNLNKAKKELRYVPTSFKEGLRKTFAGVIGTE